MGLCIDPRRRRFLYSAGATPQLLQISAYQTCGLFYRFQYIDKLPTKPKSYFSFGNTLHRCAQYFFKRGQGPPTLEEFLEFYDRTWSSWGYFSKKREASDKQTGREVLTRFWEINSRDYRMPLATEKWSTVDIGGVPFRGYIDRVDISPDRRPEHPGLQEWQAGHYHERGGGEPSAEHVPDRGAGDVACCRWRSSRCTTCGRTRTWRSEARDESTLKEAEETVTSVSKSIANEEFDPRLNPSCPCDFSEKCPLFNPSADPSAPRP